MTAKDFKGIFSPSTTRHRGPGLFLSFIIKDILSIPQFLMIGALVQILLAALLPRYAWLPAILYALHCTVTMTLQTVYPHRNPYTEGVIPGNTSAQLPQPRYDPRDGTPFGAKPAAQPVVVLHLGVRFSHPLGPFAPGAAHVIRLTTACNRELRERAAAFGCIGSSTWRGSDRPLNNTLLSIYYFRSVEGLNAFAHDRVHREAWDWYAKATRKLGYTHIGVFHETFSSDKGGYETIYANMEPTLLGATDVTTVNEETGQEEWVRPIVDGKVPTLRSQYSRMGRAADGQKSEEDEW